MSAKKSVNVVIGNHMYNLSGYEEKEYLEKVASYINQKIDEVQELQYYKQLNTDMRTVLLELNIADDYFKARDRVMSMEAEMKQKDQEIYNIFDTKKLLNKPANVAVSNVSGLAGIAFWINNALNLQGDKCVSKQSECVRKIKEWIDAEYENGRQTVISDGEMKALIRKFSPDLLR